MAVDPIDGGDDSRLLLALEAAAIGVYDYDFPRGSMYWDGRLRGMFGAFAEGPVSFTDNFLNRLHPDDRDRVDGAFQACLDPAGDGVFATEYRIGGRDGEPVRWFADRGRCAFRDGRPSRMVGVVRDITADRQGAIDRQDVIDGHNSIDGQVAIRTGEAPDGPSPIDGRSADERYRLLAAATNDVVWDWDLERDAIVWSEALQTAYGWPPDHVGPGSAWWVGNIHPDDRAVVSAGLNAVLEGRVDKWNHQYRFLKGDGSYAEVLDRGHLVRDAEGAPLRMIGAMLDVTVRSQLEAQFRAVFEGANVGIVQFDPRSVLALRVNAKLCEIWGAPESEIVGRSLAQWTPSEDAAQREALHQRLATGETMQDRFEKRYRRRDGRIIWARVNLVSQTLGDAVHATAMIEDITEEKLADARREALISLGDRLRDLRSNADVVTMTAEILGRTLGTTSAGYGTVDLAAGLVTVAHAWSSDGAALPTRTLRLEEFPVSIASLRRGEVLAVADLGSASDLEADAELYIARGVRAVISVPLLQRGRLVGVLYATESAPRAWTHGEIVFVREVAERAWSGLTRIEADEQQRILNRELSHRMKNTLAMVQAIASQSLRNVTDIEAAKHALAARLIALGKAHDILLTGERESAGMSAVVTSALSLHDDHQPGRFHLSGPEIVIGSKAALSLALMMHELATNAAKYGALSRPDGRVIVEWSVAGVGGDDTIHITWSEQGGPPVQPPTRKGFGSRLIERGLAGAVGGEVSIDYEPGGLICRVVAPLCGFQGGL
ncbi:PAS domain-containing protein [Methylobacterium sp. 77]|uniref:PAS domain-containing protein n=1 Tax=Methylobacterium sp. 77 TaxID=1101192 RepID=UPI000363A030|nr:PAS domain-containing protein [Methylobacterium sp. 77]